MSCRRILASLTVAALLAAPALAQPPEGGRGRMMQGMGFGGGMMLLRDKGIQAELKLSEEQVTNLRALMEKQGEEMRAAREGGGDPQEMREKMMEMGRKYQEEANKILNEEQQKRLKQLGLQAAQKMGGWSALAMNPEVGKALELTDEQKEALQAAQEEMRGAMREAFQGGGGDREEMRKKMEEMRKGMNEKIEKLMTDAQKAKLKELMGEPYKGEFPTGRRGPGGV